MPFSCDHCRETVSEAGTPPTCSGCGTSYRLGTAGSSPAVLSSPSRRVDSLALVLLLVGVLGLVADRGPEAIPRFLVFFGFALHFGNGLRVGALSSRFLVLGRGVTVFRAVSPMTFHFAAILEGAWVLVLFFYFLASD